VSEAERSERSPSRAEDTPEQNASQRVIRGSEKWNAERYRRVLMAVTDRISAGSGKRRALLVSDWNRNRFQKPAFRGRHLE